MIKRQRKVQLIITILLTIAGFDMVAQGLRMTKQYFFNPGSYYVPNLFDIFYDWLFLVILGLIVFIYGIFNFYKLMKSKSTGNDKHSNETPASMDAL